MSFIRELRSDIVMEFRESVMVLLSNSFISVTADEYRNLCEISSYYCEDHQEVAILLT